MLKNLLCKISSEDPHFKFISSASLLALYKFLVVVINNHLPSEDFLVGSIAVKFTDLLKRSITYSSSFCSIPFIGTIAILLRNVFCVRIMRRIVLSVVIVFKPYGMNLKCGSSEEILQRRFFNMYTFVGAHLISYANVVTRYFPLPSPTSRLCRSKAGMKILTFPVGFPSILRSWWIISLQSSSSKSIHMS